MYIPGIGKSLLMSLFKFLLISIQDIPEMTKFFFSVFRSVILLASSDDERHMLMSQKDVNKDSPVYMSSIFWGTYQDNSELMQQDGRGQKTANLL